MGRSRRPLAIVVIVLLAVAAVALGVLVPRPVIPPTAVTAPTPGPSPTPRPTASPRPTLRVDGLATVTSPVGVVVRETPKSKGKALRSELESGDIVYLTRARLVNGVDWWEVQADQFVDPARVEPPFGWIRATDDDGHSTLTPFAPDCPNATGTVDPRAIARIHTLQALACFGNRELTVEGDLVCYGGVRDGGSGGVWWKNSYWYCVMDEALGLNGTSIDALAVGSPPESVRARFRATGHFDDPEARRCHMLGIGVSLTAPGEPEPEAVIWCRQDFLVTQLTKID